MSKFTTPKALKTPEIEEINISSDRRSPMSTSKRSNKLL